MPFAIAHTPPSTASSLKASLPFLCVIASFLGNLLLTAYLFPMFPICSPSHQNFLAVTAWWAFMARPTAVSPALTVPHSFGATTRLSDCRADGTGACRHMHARHSRLGYCRVRLDRPRWCHTGRYCGPPLRDGRDPTRRARLWLIQTATAARHCVESRHTHATRAAHRTRPGAARGRRRPAPRSRRPNDNTTHTPGSNGGAVLHMDCEIHTAVDRTVDHADRTNAPAHRGDVPRASYGQ